ncbi:ribosomal protein S12 methylthiotransferase accessory factor [Rathayibacter sp. PhB127]|uniref:TOMM precursor leader peptide-binding protein n=1 Tax=Rathayibacter sp. PhB127 TaxID=2485176 RepID=UPI000FABEE96|nr:TOMM precursor leader peptide-binding protein [Rathayibacter sp. PhB127]ROS28672.1 ribosomal protein S12 methylthiotransferase accessory factor [Rathayibacter sp. PhB127]
MSASAVEEADPADDGLLQCTLAGIGALSGVAVRASDTWRIPSRPAADVPWLPVHVEVSRIVIGPLVRPGLPGCPQCLALRRERLGGAEPWRVRLRAEYAEQLEGRRPEALDELAADVAAIALERLLARECEAAGAQRRVAVVRLDTLEVESHAFLPEPLCELCGDLPEDTAAAAQHVLAPQPKSTPFGARIRDVVSESDALRSLYIDPFCGTIAATRRGDEGGLVMAAAPMPMRLDGLVEPGYGRGRDYRSAEVTAVLEALERYGGVAPGGRRSTVRGSYQQLAADAVHPDVFGRHPDESYDDPAFRYRRFDEDVPIQWVWAHSFAEGRARLVPEALAYYFSQRLRGDDPVSYYEVSNGCALGSSWEEAALHGLLETVERDAFLCTWYTRSTPAAIDLTSCRDPLVPAQAAAITAATGYDVTAFDVTTDWGIPAVWLLATRQGGSGPAALCTAGAGLDPERALLGAMNELGPILADLLRRYPGEEAHAAQMVRDPSAVRTMLDHSALSAHPDARHRLDFLRGGPTIRADDIGGADRVRPDAADLAVDLRAAVDRIGEVLVVDQTTPEHRTGGFACVKVLVPGAVPMTFGHRNRRIDGLPRLLELPRRLGRLDRDLLPDELNPDPHPFP